MVGSVAAHLAQTPCCGSSHTLVFVFQGVSQRIYALGLDDPHGESLVEGGDVAQSDNSWQGLPLSFRDEINDSDGTTRVADQFGKIETLFSNFSDADGCVFSDQIVIVFKSVKNLWEDVIVDHNFCQIDGMSRDISQAGANLSLELRILMVDELSEEGYCSGIDNKLSQLW